MNTRGRLTLRSDDFGIDHMQSDEEDAPYNGYDKKFDPYDPESQFRAATAAIVDCQGDFQQSDDILYDFLYKFRDAASQTNSSGSSLLHIAVDAARDHQTVKTANMKPLIQNLLKEHPHLLSSRNIRGETPLFIAILINEVPLVEAMTDDCTSYPEWESALKNALDIACLETGKTCLHVAFEGDIPSELIEILIRFSSDKALATRGADGKTPLHYAVNYKHCTAARTQIIDLFISRDEMAAKKPGQTFLDVVDFNENSVYRQHIESKEHYLEHLRQIKKSKGTKGKEVPALEATKTRIDKPTANQTSPPEKDALKSAGSSGSLRNESKANFLPNTHLESGDTPPQPDNAEDEKTPDNDKKALQSTKITTKIPVPKLKTLMRNSYIICERLKLHYMRTRNTEMVISFLYGKNLNDVQITFDYQGLPLEVSDDVFQRAFRAMKFDSVLQYVSFPRNVKVHRTSEKTYHNKSDVSLGRRDMLFFFYWLMKKGVVHIINLQVDDMAIPCHSDEVILDCLRGITIDNLDWQKIDLDPQTIVNLGERRGLRYVSLRWSGNNTALRAWSELEGLPKLDKLMGINLYMPPSDQMIDSQGYVQRNLDEFKSRLLKNSEISGNKNGIKISIKDMGSVLSKGSILSAVEDAAAAPRWLDRVILFASLVETLLDSVRNVSLRANKDIVVALIDDGVDVCDPLISDHIVGGRSFAYSGKWTKPYYVSETSHGTIIASTVLKVCPMAQLYSIRLETTPSEDGTIRINLKSAALAIQTALDKEAAVILMPWCIPVSETSGEEQEQLDIVLHRARDSGVLMFCSSPDIDSPKSMNYYPARYGGDGFFRIGTAKSVDETMDLSGLADRVDFIFPGDEMIKRNNEIAQMSEKEIIQLGSVSGSSVAAALGAGLAATILYCYQIAESLDTVDKPLERYPTPRFAGRELAKHVYMMAAFQNLGRRQKHKFIDVWESLDPVIEDLQNRYMPEMDKCEIISRFCERLCYKW